MLTNKYRPKRFEDISSQLATRLVLARMVETGRVPTGLLFAGVRGSGKTTAARILAAALNCRLDVKPCGECSSCKGVFEGTGLSALEIDAASNGGVAEIRSLVDSLQYRSSGDKRIVILDEAHSMSREAFDALLSVLEEPPPSTVFILSTTAQEKLPLTILSRLMTFEFRMVAVEDIVARLSYIAEQEHIKAEPDLLQLIAFRASGGMRDAIMMLDQISRADICTLDQFENILSEPDYGPELISAMMTGNVAVVFEQAAIVLARVGSPAAVADHLVVTLRDALVLRAGGRLNRQGASLKAREALAGLCDPARVFAALRVTWDLRTKTRVGENPHIALDLALVMMTEALSGRVSKSEKAIEKSASKALSLDEMRST